MSSKRIATIHLVGISTYSHSKFVFDKKPARETHADYEERTWRNRIHSDANGNMVIPLMSIKKALTKGEGRLNRKIPGAGAKTYVKYFESSVQPAALETPILVKGKPVKAAEVPGVTIPSSADGTPGGATKVLKTFACVEAPWEAKFDLYVTNELITNDVFLDALIEAGHGVGIGRWRLEKGGMNGRFNVKSVKWRALEL